MHQRYRAKGIFIKKQDQGEADQLLTIFTEQFGKIEVVAKGIRKITSKLRAGADVFYLSEIEFVQGKSYKILTDAVAVDRFDSICQEPEKSQIIYKIVELLNQFANQEATDEKLWRFLLQTFEVIENLEIRNLKLEIICHYSLWKFFAVLGYSPELHHCPLCCKKLLPETFFFVPSEGGVVCWQCFSANDLKKSGLWFPIKVDTVKALRVWLSQDWAEAGKVSFGQEAQQNLWDISKNYFIYLRENIS
ncbi:MAG: DNA repair protein RecO [Candidatus Gribaldobacteria bacterium]|nr:DNA repair protein RecO [Candidatus Gribaldobacteria bacterium]